MIKTDIISLLKKVAQKSPVVKSKHCACILVNNKIVSIQYNDYSKRIKTIHAEVNAIINTKRIYKNKNAKMIVIRVDKSGNLKLSKPCDDCINFINNNNIIKLGTVLYSN